jgi:hypothetical protein
MKLQSRNLLLVSAAAVSLAACGGGKVKVVQAPATPAAPVVVAAPATPAPTVVTVVPATPAPPANVEVAGVSPGSEYVWVPGFYDWRGGRYEWVPGTYIRTPRPAAVWVPGQWQPTTGGYMWVPGHWQ